MPRTQQWSVNAQIPYDRSQGERIGGQLVRPADVRREFVMTPAGRISLGALRAQQEAADNAGEIDPGQTVRDAREAFTRAAQLTQSGSQVYSPEQRQQRAEISRAGLAALDVVGPLAQAGLLNNAQLSALLTKEVGSAFVDQRRQKQIGREIQALESQYRAGRLTESSMQKAINSMYNAYGPAMISHPSFSTLTGLEEQRANALEQKRQAYAASEGLPLNRVRINPDTGAPQFDAQAAMIDGYKNQMADSENQRNVAAYNAKSKDYTVRLASLERQMGVLAGMANQGDAVAASDYVKMRSEYMSLLQSPVMTSDTRPTYERQISAMAPEQFGAKSAPPSFNFGSNDEAIKAATAGTWPAGIVGNIKGVPYRVHADGTIKRVRN